MNSLVVSTEDSGPALSECYKSLDIVASGVEVARTFANGDCFTLNGFSARFSLVADLASFVVDPIASMAGSVAGFLIDYMPPLPEMLDSLAGSPQAVADKAGTWYNVAERTKSTADEYAAQADSALTGWTGMAADSYRTFAGAFTQSLVGLSDLCSSIGTGLSVASSVVGLVRSIVRDIICDLVGNLISWASQVIATAGVGATWVVPQAVTAIALRVEKVRGWLTKLLKSMKEACELLGTLNDCLKTATPSLKRIGDSLEQIPVVSTRGILDPQLARTAPNLNDVFSPVVPSLHKATDKLKAAGEQYSSSTDQADGASS